MIEKNALIHPERKPRRRRGERTYLDPNAVITSELMNRAFDEIDSELLHHPSGKNPTQTQG